MKSTLLLAIAASLLELSEAASLPRRKSPSVLSLQTHRKQTPNPIHRDRLRKLRKRDGTLSADLDNESALYYVNVTIGTPGQRLRLDIDTGSSDIWCNSDDSEFCQQNDGSDCRESGTFNANHSSTYEYVNSDFKIQYVDNSEAAGDYATDTLNIGGNDIDDIRFGIGYTSTSAQGILGVGYMSNEVQRNTDGKTYPNLPQALVDRGTIQSNAYSLWLNDLSSETGNVLFGGIDSDKYEGSLQTVPIVKQENKNTEFIIALTGLSSQDQDLMGDMDPFGVLLDSGASLSYLPNDIALDLYDMYGLESTTSDGVPEVDCDLANSEDSVEFSFSGINITVPMNELILTSQITATGKKCVFGIGPSDDGLSVLGDTFLRSAYVVYDLENNQISLAKTNFNSTSSDIQEIGTGEEAVPDATLIKDAVTSVADASGGGRCGGCTVVSGVERSLAPGGRFALVMASVGVAVVGGVLELV
ncbi:acid protease [Aulographum hederae CBS 113979]|uniref:Probable aspartic-type endopeptidase OPSB n=1 Tax=Aulographum hederae CBS 113979 TaxID=1176131 RepID=A0A6G1HAT2_9PEZI|nr:acid protease [Aulographum hederae CBS 113979]